MYLQYFIKVVCGHILTPQDSKYYHIKMERYHCTVNEEINLLPYETPTALEKAIRGFVQYYNYQRYHKALGDVTRHLEIL